MSPAFLAAQRRHLLAVEQTGHETETFVHLGTLPPRHFALPAKAKSVNYVPGMKCHHFRKGVKIQLLSHAIREDGFSRFSPGQSGGPFEHCQPRQARTFDKRLQMLDPTTKPSELGV